MHNFMDWLTDRPYRMFGSMGLVFVTSISALVYFGVQEQKQWNAFAAEHQCKVTGKIAGYSTYGYHNGKYQTYYVPSRTVYKCNDGIEYTR